MDMTVKVALLLLFAASRSVAGQGIICMSPQIWESNIFTYYQGENQEPSAVRRGKESYDAQNLRRRFIEEIDTSTERDYYDELYLHKEETGYRLNLRTRECEKFVLTEPFHYIEVPPNTTLDATYFLGSPEVAGNSVEMHFYSGDTERGYYRGSWTAKDCIPYIHSYLSQLPTPNYHRTVHYDVTMGISDPNVFDVPPECQ